VFNRTAGTIVDGAAVPAIFKREVGGISHVEGDHVVVHVAAEVDSDRDAEPQARIAASADVVEGITLKHNVIDALWSSGSLRGCDGVVARIAEEKGEANNAAGRAGLCEVRDTEAEEVAVKAQSLIQAVGIQEDVAEAHVAGLEAAHGACRMEGLLVDRATAEDPGTDAIGVGAFEEIYYAAIIGLVAAASGHRYAAALQLLDNAPESSKIWHLPANKPEVVAAVRAQLHTVVILVHAEIGNSFVVAGNDLHTENNGSEVVPCLRAADVEAKVTELRDTGHDVDSFRGYEKSFYAWTLAPSNVVFRASAKSNGNNLCNMSPKTYAPQFETHHAREPRSRMRLLGIPTYWMPENFTNDLLVLIACISYCSFWWKKV
jgi:hypothetical protein